MPRRRRLDPPDSWHHVMNRGAGRRTVFRDDSERQILLDRLGEIEDRFGVEVHAYCLMDNHYHVLVRSRVERLSDAMKWVGQRFTQHVNHRRGVDGAIFRGRFHSVSVHQPEHRRWLFRYINANPNDLGWARPLVEYPWSGLAASVGRPIAPGWLRTDEIDRLFDDRAGFLRFVEGSGPSGPAVAPTIEAIQNAAVVASLPGPTAQSTADIAAVVTTICVSLGYSGREIDALAHLDPGRRVEAIRRYAERIRARPELAAFHDRTISVLGLQSFLRAA